MTSQLASRLCGVLLAVGALACSPAREPLVDAGELADADCAGECGDAATIDASSAAQDAGVAPSDAGDPFDAGTGGDAGERVDSGAADAGCRWDCGENEVCVSDQRQCICAEGFHACNGTCVSSNRVETCGGRCAPCPEAAFGSAVCVSGQCRLECEPGFHQCGNLCVPDSSTATCGTRCEPCAGGAHGVAICVAGECSLSCGPGYRLCNGACAACPAGSTATVCDGASCVATTCESGKLACNGRCALCPIGAKTTACDGASCVVTTCESGMLACDGRCAACPVENVAAVRCEAGKCVVDACADGSHLCGEVCMSDHRTASCGSRCEPCPTTPGGYPTCVAGQCGVGCLDGYQLCGGRCAWCTQTPSALSFGCGAADQCVPTSCAPGYSLCTRGCCPATVQGYEAVGGEALQPITFRLDSAGRPHAVWRSNSSTGTSLNYSERLAAGWQTTSLLQSGVLSVMFELDASDSPHVAYVLADSLYYATRRNGTWQHELVAPTLHAGFTIDASGQPMALVVHLGQLILMRRTGTGWTEEVAATGVVPAPIVLAMGPDGEPHALLNHYDGQPMFPHYARRTNTGWHFEVVAQRLAFAKGITMSQSGSVYVVYRDVFGTPWYAERLGSAIWSEEQIPHWHNDISTSIAVSTSGTVHVGFKKPQVGYSTRTATGWETTILEPFEGAAAPVLRFDPLDRLHMVYGGWDFDAWMSGLTSTPHPALVYAH